MTYRCLLLTLLFVIPWLAAPDTATAQEASPTSAREADDGYPTFTAEEIQLTVFTPENLVAGDLYGTVRALLGRSLWIEGNGLRQDRPRNLQLLGDSILIFDTPDYTKQVLMTLTRLDAEAASADQTPPRALREADLALFEYRPRFTDLRALADALEPFQRVNNVYREEDDRRFEVVALTPAWTQGMLIVRDTPQAVAEIKAFLGRIDVPAPHVTVSCLVLKATRGQGSDELPEELVSHLSQLVPYDQFALQTMGLVQSAVSPKMNMIINMPLPDQVLECSLGMEVEAFDEVDSALTLREARFSVDGDLTIATRVTLKAGEYVVLGASGPEPMFVVMRMQATGTRPSSAR